MARTYLLLILFFLLLPVCSPAVVAAADGSEVFEVQAASSTRVEAGDTVTVKVSGRALADLYSSEILLGYDPEQLEYTGYTSPLGGQAFVMNPALLGERIRLVFTFAGSKPGLTGDLDLYSLTFKALSPGTAAVGLEHVRAFDHTAAERAGTVGSGVQIKIVDKSAPSSGGGSSSPDSGETGTPAQAAKPEPQPEPEPSSSYVRVEAAVDASGLAAAKVAAAELQRMARPGTQRTMTIEVHTTGDPAAIQVNLPAAALREITAAGGTDTVRIQTGFAAVSISSHFLNNLEAAAASNLQLTVAKSRAEELAPHVRERLGSAVVYDYTLSLDGKKLTRLGRNDIKVEVPYTPAPGGNPNQVVIYYIPDAGEPAAVPNSQYDPAAGTASFKPQHFSRYAAAYAHVSFDDVERSSWAYNAVLALAARGAVDGRGEGQFVPEHPVTRAEFVHMLVQLFELEDPAAVSPFEDAAQPEEWHYRSIASAYQLGLVNGRADGTFGVGERISREQMAVIIHRLGKHLELELPQTEASAAPADEHEISEYAKEAAAAVQQAGVMTGTGEGQFEPQGQATRAMAAAVLYRMFSAAE